jgi:hypothetical protein
MKYGWKQQDKFLGTVQEAMATDLNEEERSI